MFSPDDFIVSFWNQIYINILFKAKHAETGNFSWGIDGEKGTIVNMEERGVWDPYAVKAQTYKTAIEVSVLWTFCLKVLNKRQVYIYFHVVGLGICETSSVLNRAVLLFNYYLGGM